MQAIARTTEALVEDGTAPAAAKPWRAISVETDIVALEAAWRDLEMRALVTPYQSYGWVRAYAETIGAAEGMIFRYVLLRDEAGALCALLPLVVTRRSGARFAEFIGGKHANYHMGLYAPELAARFDAELAGAMLAEVGAAIGGLDALVFVNQPVAWQGQPNPPALIASGPSPSRAYKLALIPGDGDATFKRSMSSHSRKKLKNKHSRFADFGPSTVRRALKPAEIEQVVDAFLAQKAERFRLMGIPDPFAPPAIRRFLIEGALGEQPALEIYSLDLAGRCVSTYIGAVQGGRFSGMATAFDMASETVKTSPGELLLAELIRLKCDEGFTSFDLGVGEARYKTSFCDDHDDLVDSFLPLTAKGRIFVALARARRDIKRRIKASPLALRLAQRLSGLLRRKTPASEAE
ncbi:GNAT family N-acetyltransferase [Bosea sp. (in: a-proteobacteria)]|uniref:GNAT family N-acetyltransferase n=1 Tax=Bosea sp. (in: a-proteobacteria) TaxID=1871050 RepID=UPI001220990B|nr:GNAT family N-acetyltransferase [Bosea sp. (in: a-proteobacteria)]TAJ30163.1 MAG: GNAT family N-acetyltransferase [Bosea sp. (in: a-proteobacteria)]